MKFLNVLTVLFAAAKIFGFIDWSWLIIFLPTMLAFITWVTAVVVITIAEIKS